VLGQEVGGDRGAADSAGSCEVPHRPYGLNAETEMSADLSGQLPGAVWSGRSLRDLPLHGPLRQSGLTTIQTIGRSEVADNAPDDEAEMILPPHGVEEGLMVVCSAKERRWTISVVTGQEISQRHPEQAGTTVEQRGRGLLWVTLGDQEDFLGDPEERRHVFRRDSKGLTGSA
jgi:hypothetical protein